MKAFISKWSNWWIFNPKRKQLDEAFEKELNDIINKEVESRMIEKSKSIVNCRVCGKETDYDLESKLCPKCW